jgi:hypothetical protein
LYFWKSLFLRRPGLQPRRNSPQTDRLQPLKQSSFRTADVTADWVCLSDRRFITKNSPDWAAARRKTGACPCRSDHSNEYHKIIYLHNIHNRDTMGREFSLLRPTSHSGLPPIDSYPFRIRTCDLFQTKGFNPVRIPTYRSQVRSLITGDFKPSRINTYKKNSCNSFVFRTYEKRGAGGLYQLTGRKWPDTRR